MQIKNFICKMNKLVTIILILSVGFVSAQQKYSVVTYIEEYKSIAIKEMQKYGIPASIKLGQGILESSAGNSELARKANNHFGIKCKKDWKGKKFYQDDDEKNECFRKYENVLASYEDHSIFLKSSARYSSLFDLKKTDYSSWAYGLKAAGYATNPKYAQLLIKTIEENKLYLFDENEKNTPNNNDENTKLKEKKTNKKTDSKEEFKEFTIGKSKSRNIENNNGVNYFLAKNGDTYESLTLEFDLMDWQLKKYNDINKDYAFKEGEFVYIQPKRRKAKIDSYQLGKNENLRDVSQKYGVKLKRIYAINDFDISYVPKEGTIIKLR